MKVKTAKEQFGYYDSTGNVSPRVIKFTNDHFDKAIEKLEADRDRIKKELNDISDLVHQAVILGIIETYNKSIYLLKEYKKEEVK